MTQSDVVLVAAETQATLVQLRPMLTEMGLIPVSARDGDEVLRLIERESPLVLLAETSEVIDGYRLASRLRKSSDYRTLPIVLMGSEDQREGRLAALTSGADEFISKPLDLEDVRLRLAAILRRIEPTAGHNSAEDALPALIPGQEGQRSNQARSLYSQLVLGVNAVLAQAAKGETLNLEPLCQKRELLVGDCAFDELMVLASHSRKATDLGAHHVNVTILALAIGRELGLPSEELSLLGSVALVHDLGMVDIPETITTAPRRLSTEEYDRVTQHPLHTYQMLRLAGAEYWRLADIAHQEHERENGQGYPRGLKGDEIHPLAKIIAVADVYEACTHPRPYQKTYLPYEALQILITMRDDYLAPRYIKALINAITLYPVGSYVQLNTGEIGQVRAANRKNLMRPVVAILFRARGEPLRLPKTIDLTEHPLLSIARALYEPPSTAFSEIVRSR